MAAFAVVFVLLAVPHFMLTDLVPLLAERYFPGTGLIEIVLVSLYASWLTEALPRGSSIGRIRQRVWLLFSVVFFTQVVLGLLGVEKMLMTGSLHLPVPAVIVAGPVFRGHGLFMPILFLATVVVAGPAWCSWLCYVGAWDNLAAGPHSARHSPPRYRTVARIAILAGIVATALSLRFAGADTSTAVLAGAGFGVVGILIMATLSRRRGLMVHCTMYCPIGLLSTAIGRINPFRLSIGSACTTCMECSHVCRYGALERSDIRNRKPGFTCTLCGDCTSVCRKGVIRYRFPGLRGDTPRKLFMVIVVSLHAVFLAFARI